MRISVKVKPNSHKEKIERIGENAYKIWVKEPPREGKANEAVLEIIGEHFRVPKSHLKIVSGISSKDKIVEII